MAASSHGITVCRKGAVYIQSGLSSLSARYGDSCSSNCFLLASLCILFMASAKAVRLGAMFNSRFSMPPHPAPGMLGDPRDIGVSRLDARLEPGTQEIPNSIGEPGGSPSSNWSSCLVTGDATPLARPLTPESPEPPEVGRWMEGMIVLSSPYAGDV